MDDPACRFCLEGEQNKENPLVCPCNCKGSMAYVHKECIRKWRRTTQNPHYLVKCPLCMVKYKLPNMHPMEILPEYTVSPFVTFMRQAYVTWIFSYIHSITCQYWLMRLYEYWSNESFSNFSPSIHSTLNKASYFITMNVFTYMYYIYYYERLVNIRNKTLYANYWLCAQLPSNQSESPRTILQLFIFCYVFAPHYPSPFYIMYIMLLAQFYKTHNAILIQINHDNT